MLRIVPTTSAGNAKRYHRDGLEHEDYYTGKETAVGRWFGKGAEKLGLHREVKSRDYKRLCDNLIPATGEPLTARTRADRRVAYDFTFSCPKSASLLAALGGDERVMEAFRAAVRATMTDIETEAKTRVRMGGVEADRPTGNLVWAEFIHHTARPVDGIPDPHLHAHCVVFNATFDPVESRWKALQVGDIKSDGPYFEAAFLSRFAANLNALGYEVEAKGRYWEVVGIPPSMVEKFSRRTEHIELEAAARGVTDAADKAGLGAKTRARKNDGIAGDELKAVWESRLSHDERAALESLVDRRRASPEESERDESDERSKPEERETESPSEKERDQEASGERADEKKQTDEKAESKETSDSRSESEREDSTQEDGSGEANGQRKSDGDAESHDATGRRPRNSRSLRETAEHARDSLFERSAVVPERALLEEALRLAPGKADVDGWRAEFERLGLIRRERDGVWMVTSPEVLREEKKMVDMAIAGRGRWRPFSERDVEAGKYPIADEQLRAANHVLRSGDFVTLVEGPAGTGKTTTFHAVRQELWESGGPFAGLLPDRLIALAPTAQASRGVLKADGFEHATTVAQFLEDTKRHSFARKVGERALDRLVWIDEGSLHSTQSMVQVMERCKSNGWRIVISHDPSQHHAVARGSCIPVLKEHAGVDAARIEEIRRQRGEYRDAVQALADGRCGEGFSRLEAMGAVRETEKGEAARQAAADYLRSTRSGKSALMVAASHAEKDDANAAVRADLKKDGQLKKAREFTHLKPSEGTLADRERKDFYHNGQVVQFHQNAWGFKAGSRWTVIGVDPFGNVAVRPDRSVEKQLHIKNPEGWSFELKSLPLGKADRFEVYEKSSIEVAVGDLVRVTRNGKTFSVTESVLNDATGANRYPTRDLNNGSVCRVKRFTKDGNLHLDNGLIVPKDFGHIDHGYCSTSFDAQGKTVDRVIVPQTAKSGRAAGAEEFYVAVSRGRESVVVYTDDARALREAVGRTTTRLSAMDLVKEPAGHDQVKAGIDRSREEERARQQPSASGSRKEQERGFDRERT